MLHRGSIVLLGALALLAGVATGDAKGQPRLFADAGESEGSDGLSDPTVIRGHLVEIDLDLLAAIQPDQGDTLVFNLFENVSLVAVFERVERRSSDRYTWYGALAGVPNGTFTLVVEHGVVVANIRAPHRGSYQVRYLAGSGHVVREIDETKFPPCGTGARHEVRAPAGGAGAGARGGDDGSVIDVLVVYTADARDGAGGTEAMNALIELAVAETNTAYENSLINPSVNLVHTGEIDYDESGTAFLDHLCWLTCADGACPPQTGGACPDPGGSIMDEVHALRDSHGADMVALLVEDLSSCGIGWLMTTLSPDFESKAFSVTSYVCATGNYTFGHELGHNMGSHHDRDNADEGLFDYSYGYQEPNEAFRTVMSYDCPDGCPRVQHFSNPDVDYEGQPTGVPVGDPASAHNALSINNAASTAANWRETINTCDELFADDVVYGVGAYPRSVAIADLDGDGDADLAVAGPGSDNVSVLLNDGNGTFGPNALYDAGDLSMSVAIGDLDGDGDADLAVANWDIDNVSVLLNNGDATFADDVLYGAGDAPRSVAIGDLDGDGDGDLAVANWYSDNVSVLLNNGDGTFAADVLYDAGNAPTSVAIGDLDGDGDADLAVANRYTANVSVLLNDGDGIFAVDVLYDVGVAPHSVAIGDFDGDGNADLAVANNYSDNVSILLNNGDGTFAPDVLYGAGDHPTSVVIGDLDGDGDADLAVANLVDDNVSVLLNNGDGTFADEVLYGAGTSPFSVAIGDLDGDGDPDLAVANLYSANVSVLLNQCGAQAPCEGDANSDGTVDPLDSGFVLARFGCPVGTGDPDCDAADQNGDGLVDPLDAGYVLARFGGCL